MKIHSNNLNKNIGGEGGSFLKDDLQIYSKEDVIKEALKYANGQKTLKYPPKHPKKLRRDFHSVDSSSTISGSRLRDIDLLDESEADGLMVNGGNREEKVVKRIDDNNFLYIPKDELGQDDTPDSDLAVNSSEEILNFHMI